MEQASVLIVEDEAIVARELEICLQQMGYEVAGTAASGEDAIALALREQPDVILLDIRLQGATDGIATAEVLGDQSRARVIFLTAHSDDDTIARARCTDPAGFLIKPWNPKELHAMLQLALQQRKRSAWEQRNMGLTLGAILDALPAGVIVALAPDGEVILANREARRLLGVTPGVDRMVHYRFWGGVDPAGQLLRSERWPVSRALLEAQSTWGEEIEVRRPAEPSRVVSASALPLRDPEGQIDAAVMVLADVSEHYGEQKRWRNALQELTRSNDELEKYAYTLSHDMREPLRSISAFSGMLDVEYREHFDERGRTYLKYILSGVDRLAALIQSHLLLAKLGGTPGEQDFRMGSALEDAIANLSSAIKASGAEISAGILPEVRANRTQFVQLFQNLLENAIKFRGAATPAIRVDVERTNTAWLFSVEDNGKGVDPKHWERIFEPLNRADAGKIEGVGLGLALCRSIVERHGGKIWVRSAPERGSTFWFTLPQREFKVQG